MGGERATASPTLLEPWPHSWPPGHWLHMTLEKWRHHAPAPRSQAEKSAVREGAKDSQARQTSPSSLATTASRPCGSISRPPPLLRPLLGASRSAWGTTQGPRQWSWYEDPPPSGHPARQGCALFCSCNPLYRGRSVTITPTLWGEPEQRGHQPIHTP